MTAYLLDTNIISAVLRKDAVLEERLRQTIPARDEIWLSAIVFYESKRGLLKRDARKQMQALDHLVARFEWCDVLREDWEPAAQLWAERFQVGRPIDDADLLIAVQAKRLGAILVTDNEKDFDGLGVEIENWRGSTKAR
jgi:tRNA(fMet)-specific endonuclease VapC